MEIVNWLLATVANGRIAAPHRATVTRAVVRNTGYRHSTRIEVCLGSSNVLFRS